MLKRRFKRWCGALLLVTGVVVVVDAVVVEPRWLEVTHHDVRVPVASKLRVAHITDLHLRHEGAIERAVLDALAAEQPDVIVITGDVYDTPAGKRAAEAFVTKLSAPLGVFFVLGNHEHWTHDRGTGPYLDAANVRTVVNEAARVRDDVWVAGLDDAFAGHPNVAEATDAIPDDVAVVGLLHSPGYFEKIAAHVDVALAGHTHADRCACRWWAPFGCHRCLGPTSLVGIRRA